MICRSSPILLILLHVSLSFLLLVLERFSPPLSFFSHSHPILPSSCHRSSCYSPSTSFHSYVYNVAVNYHHYSCHTYIYRIVPYDPVAPIRWHVTELDLRSTLASVCKKVTRLMNWTVDLISLRDSNQLLTITFSTMLLSSLLLSLLPRHHYHYPNHGHHFHRWFLPPLIALAATIINHVVRALLTLPSLLHSYIRSLMIEALMRRHGWRGRKRY